MTGKDRIEFIDLAKGICIILVVLGHLVPAFNTNLTFVFCFRMPLYFCLSGLFYKDYGGLRNLTLKKINKILIPFVAWYLIGYGIYYLGRRVVSSGLEDNSGFHILDLFVTNDIFNIPIWFLLCLFWSNIVFAIVSRFAKTEPMIGIGVLIIALMGWLLSLTHIFNLLYIGSALSCLPFFYMGYILKRSALLLPTIDYRKDLIIMFLCLTGAVLFAFIPEQPPRFQYYTNNVAYGNAIQIYACAALFVIGILLLCKLIGHIPFVSWLGRYSIIVLVTHMWLSTITGTLLTKTVGRYVSEDTKNLMNFSVVIMLMLVVIPFCKKWLPHITAQKELMTNKTITNLRKLINPHKLKK